MRVKSSPYASIIRVDGETRFALPLGFWGGMVAVAAEVVKVGNFKARFWSEMAQE